MNKNGMRPIHPGEVLREEFLIPAGMKNECLPEWVKEIASENNSITTDAAIKLASFFDTTPEFWAGLQNTYNLRKTEPA